MTNQPKFRKIKCPSFIYLWLRPQAYCGVRQGTARLIVLEHTISISYSACEIHITRLPDLEHYILHIFGSAVAVTYIVLTWFLVTNISIISVHFVLLRKGQPSF